jgi:pimeloyl-ACP methyl ester carboxylesterase
MTSEVTERLGVEVAEGRAVEVLTAGAADGLPLVFHTGTPSGLVPYPALTHAAARHGLRCVLYSRPGYGNSDPQPGRRVADAAGDVAAILDHLGAGHFVSAGWSGGGPHALACAAALPDRCLAAATIAGVAPYSAPGLDWLSGMAAENIDEFGAAVSGEAELTAVLTEFAAGMRDLTGAGIVEAFGSLVTEPDIAALAGDFAGYLAQALSTAVATGIAGWRDDDLAFVKDWGFAVSQVDVPVTVWQGEQDAMVPLAHGAWLAGNVLGARPRLMPDEGHLSLVVNHIEAIVADLADAAAGRK